MKDRKKEEEEEGEGKDERKKRNLMRLRAWAGTALLHSRRKRRVLFC